MIYDKIVKSGSLCFDIGANIGDKTNYMLSLGAKVIAFEPLSECYGRLQVRYLGNSNVVVENIGLSDKKETKELRIGSYHSISSMSEDFIREASKERFAGYSWNNVEHVQVDTLDNMITKHGMPDYCKLDVEGYEYNVLLGLSKSVPCLSIEFTPELKDNTLKCMEHMLSINADYVFNYTEQESMEFIFPEYITKDAMWNYLKNNNDFKVSFGDLFIKLK
jgi:FkbM family methyltransferase